jgi:hypothetical protein
VRVVPAGVEVDCYVSVGRLRYMGVELHGQAGSGVAEPGPDDPGVLSLFDHETGCDVTQPVEGEVLGHPRLRDGRLEDALLEITTERSAQG